MILSEAERVMRRLADRNPAINGLVDALDLDLISAKITKLDPTK
jgi:hypothetical protein